MLAEVQTAIVQKTNELRRQDELPAVEPNDELTAAASKFAKFMAETEKYGHRADGKTPAQRAQEADYQYCVVRENIAYRVNPGQVTTEGLIDAFVNGWFESPPHRENMLADYVTHTGVAVATADGITYYAVQMFGRPTSATIKLKVKNQSNDRRILVVEANDSRDEIELPPRSLITMTRCFPATLRVEGLENIIRVAESTDIIITKDEFRIGSED
jgi:hypothetical protein